MCVTVFSKFLACTFFNTGGAFGRFVQNKLSELDIWRGSYGNARLSLRHSIEILERWVQCCETLTVQYWRRFAPHPWKSDKFVPENIPQLANRLKEVHLNMMLQNIQAMIFTFLIVRFTRFAECTSTCCVCCRSQSRRRCASRTPFRRSLVRTRCSTTRTRSHCGVQPSSSTTERWRRPSRRSRRSCDTSFKASSRTHSRFVLAALQCLQFYLL